MSTKHIFCFENEVEKVNRCSGQYTTSPTVLEIQVIAVLSSLQLLLGEVGVTSMFLWLQDGRRARNNRTQTYSSSLSSPLLFLSDWQTNWLTFKDFSLLFLHVAWDLFVILYSFIYWIFTTDVLAELGLEAFSITESGQGKKLHFLRLQSYAYFPRSKPHWTDWYLILSRHAQNCTVVFKFQASIKSN